VTNVLAHEPFVVLVVACYAIILTARPSIHVRSDTWLALVAGRLVWSDGLPHHDALTVWAHGRTWVDQQWLGQLFFYGVHAAGGLRLLVLVHVGLLVGAFGLALLFARRSGGSSRSTAIAGFLALFLVLTNSAARTQSLAYPLFVALFWLLASSRGRGVRRILLAFPLLVVWANVHGSAVLGAGLVVLWALERVVVAGRRRDHDAWVDRGRAAVIAVGAVLCLFVSPYGPSLFGYYHDVLASGAFRSLVAEWQSPTFPAQAPFFVLVLASVWVAARAPRTLRLFEHFALVATGLAGFSAVRNIVWFGLVAVMVVPRALDGAWPVKEAPLRRRANELISLVAIAVALVFFATAASRSQRAYARSYPSRAAVATADATRDPTVRIFANEAYADWLIWQIPRLSGRMALDARFELLTARQLRELAHFRHQSSPDWRSAAKPYRLLVLDPKADRAAVRAFRNEPGARTIYRDSHVVAILRAPRR
jgi:hypothetical protein